MVDNSDVRVAIDNNITALLRCYFTGYPDNINWYRNTSLLESGTTNLMTSHTIDRYSFAIYLSDDTGTLVAEMTIMYVESSDLGLYWCSGDNGYASVKGFIWLTGKTFTSVLLLISGLQVRHLHLYYYLYVAYKL